MLFKRDERRRFKRVPTHLLMKYTLLVDGGKTVLSFIRNVSPAGVLFFSEEEIASGTTIRMVMNIVSPKGIPIEMKVVAKTVHVIKVAGHTGYNVGAEFLEVDPVDKEVLIDRLGLDRRQKNMEE